MAAQLMATNGPEARPLLRVQRSGHELLAGPALARDEHRRIGLGHPANDVEHLLHRRALADHLVDRPQLADGAAEALHLLPQLAGAQRPLEGDDQLVGLERLRHEVVGARADRLHGRLDAREGGHDDHGRVLAQRHDLAAQVDAAHPAHADVAEHDAEVGLAQLPQGGFRGRLGGYLVVPLLELETQHLQHARVVVDDQNASVHRRPPSAASGGSSSRDHAGVARLLTNPRISAALRGCARLVAGPPTLQPRSTFATPWQSGTALRRGASSPAPRRARPRRAACRAHSSRRGAASTPRPT